MKALIKRLANKSFLLCLLPVLLLTFLLHSVDRFPLANESELGENERLDSRGESAIKNQNYWGVLNSIPSLEKDETVENVKHIRAPSTHEKHPNVMLNVQSSSFIANTGKTEAESLPTTPKSTIVTESSTVTPEPPRKQKKILLLSSVGRSGSSFLGLLLSALGDNMYFFEPIRGIPKSYQGKQNISEELVRYFRCDIRQKLLHVGGRVDISIIHPFTKYKRAHQVRLQDVIDHCLQEPLIIVKVIRLRLQWVRELMNRKEMDNVKVIHLVRDPRGSLTSMAKLEWKTTEVDECAKIYKDLQEREAMASLFPNRYTFVKYEDLCRDPYGEARRLVQFISDEGQKGSNGGNKTWLHNKARIDDKDEARLLDPALYQDLPQGILKYLNEHLHVNKEHRFGPFTVERETASMYQRWRWTISFEQLTKVQDACVDVIRTLGHRFFSTFADVRNSSIPLFVDNPS
ncbi:carbohydrate sulfotransferase 1-like [Portunus trituberculatus]|uniref:carbohydrate sulfotransferase 1-like n=1 Tax=Portunus trituberculatus TaxID=210409 RepID=UPI001E1CB315|nr:carbohydrate sulfotransferase 1-like [Portunus trituberculatus]